MADLSQVTLSPPPRPFVLTERQQIWRGARRWSAALVVAAFPFLFIIDAAVETRLSPVLPGILVLCLLIVALPPLLSEAARRLALNHSDSARARKVETFMLNGRTALIVAFVWFAAWLALGA